MIYLICAKDSKQRLIEIHDKENYSKNIYYKFFVDNFEHKDVLYSFDFYKHISNKIFDKRVNIIYCNESIKRIPNIDSAILVNNTRDVTRSFKNDIDDLYVFAADSKMIEIFSKLADYLVVFVSDTIGHTLQQLSDLIDFSNYDLIRYDNPDATKYRIEYYVNNKIGK